jgi:3'(2'), 5'-bisphosphate nucleotidase
VPAAPPISERAAFRAVQAAAQLCEAVRASMVRGEGPGALAKDDRSPVTVADFGSQALVCRALRAAEPDATIVAEEASAALRAPDAAPQLAAVVEAVRQLVPEADAELVCGWIDAGGGAPGERFWTLDPIDGTKGFLRDDQYAIALARLGNGAVVEAYLACPVLEIGSAQGVVLAAERSSGATAYGLDGRPLGRCAMRAVEGLAAVRLAESVESAHTDHGLSADLKRELGIGAPPLRMDSQAKYAALALGQADLYLRAPNPRSPDYRESIWDHAAGWLVLTEAGGHVSDVYGRPLDWTRGRRLEDNVGILAGSPEVHSRALSALKPHLPVP